MNKFVVFVVVAILAVSLVEDSLNKSTEISAEPIKSDFNNPDVFKKRNTRIVEDSNQTEEEDEVFVRVKKSPDPNPQSKEVRNKKRSKSQKTSQNRKSSESQKTFKSGKIYKSRKTSKSRKSSRGKKIHSHSYSNDSGLSTGEVIGIIIGIIVGLLAIGLVIYCCNSCRE